MEFKDFNSKVQIQFEKMNKTGKLFKSNISGQQVWELYLNSFKQENNQRFRDPESSEHNCNCCKNFIRRYGNILSINENGNLESIFSNISNVGEYQDSVDACNNLLINSKIEEVFFEIYSDLEHNLNYEKVNKQLTKFKLGIENHHKQYTQEEVDKFGVVNTKTVYVFNHFNVSLHKDFVDMTGKSIGNIEDIYRDKYSVFKRAMEEIPLDTLILVRDLINQGSLLDGTTHLPVLQRIIELKISYKTISNKENWYWDITYGMAESVAKFKSHLIGKLCTELAEGKELNAACESWNKRVDPINYNKAKAPITEAQKKLAEKFVVENGYIESFNRRLATIDDIKASEILHKNNDNAKAKSVTIFDSIKTSGTGRHKRSEFDKVEEVTIDKFMNDILPTATNVELLLENKFEGNLVNLTTIVDNDAKQIFKWDNTFSYTFNGNLAGKSQIKDAVKERGGNVVADVAIRLHFPDTTEDYDLYVEEPNGRIIYYGNKRQKHPSSGMLDLDAQGGDGHFPSDKRVENITYTDKTKMSHGNYVIKVNNHPGSKLHTTFYMDIEIDGELTQLKLKTLGLTKPTVSDIRWNGSEFKLEVDDCMDILESKTISKKIWNLDTNEFHKVNLVCLTPNHWGENNNGNKHFLFMLQDCKNPNQVRGFHNEHLISDLLQHRKVLDVLGNNAMIEPTDKQLAGVGFNSTVRDEVILRLSGSHKRIIKVKL